MDAKIGHKPPLEIKILDGKSPPWSWVSENIVNYYNIQSQTDVLHKLLLYAQQLQSEQVTKGTAKPLLLKESFVPLPDKGSATDIGNRASYNSIQSYIKIQIEHLEQLILVLKQGDPKLGEQLEPLLTQIRQAAQAFPRLDNQQLQNLVAMMAKLLELVKQAPNPAQRAFWNTQLKAVQTLMRENGVNIKEFQGEVRELQARSKMLISVEKLMQNIQDTLKGSPPTEKQLLQFIENLQNLANRNPLMNPTQSQALMGFLQQLYTFKTSKGEPLSHTIADAVVQTKLRAFMQANPNATTEQVQNYLNSFLNESNLQKSPLPFMKSLGDGIEEVIGREGFPESTGHSGNPFASVHEGKITPEGEFFQTLLSTYAPDPKSIGRLDTAAHHLSSAISDEVSDNSVKVEGFTSTINKLSETQNTFGSTAMWTVGQSLGVGQPPAGAVGPIAAPSAAPGEAAPGSAAPGAQAPAAAAPGDSEPNLPNEFENAILGHYMPGQEAYLKRLAIALFIDNNAAMFGNKLLEDMLGFDGAANQFNFSNGLNTAGQTTPPYDPGPYFSGSVTQMQNKLNAEIAAAERAMQKVITSEQDIEGQLKYIEEQMKTATGANLQTYQTEQKSLQSLLQNLKVLCSGQPMTPPAPPQTGQLVDLLKTLNSLTITPYSGPGVKGGPYFTIEGEKNWQSNLSKEESDVVNGSTSGGSTQGGLVNVQAMAQTFQQTYSDQGQTEQMSLQMAMTEIQQEWTVVSTALQQIFQSYMTISQAIYK